MNGKVKNVFFIVRQILDAITMVDVPIQDEHSFGSGGHGDVVEEAETCDCSPL